MILQVVVLTLIVLWFIFKDVNFKEQWHVLSSMRKMPTDPAYSIPYIGITFHLMITDPFDFFDFMKTIRVEKYITRIAGTWLLGTAYVSSDAPEDCEIIMNNSTHISKGEIYNGLRPWLNEGLLLSDGKKWHSRRKMLTPTFHFKILEDCLPIFNKCAMKLKGKISQKEGEIIDLAKVISLCTLDVICEAAMGIVLNAQDSQGTEYVKAVNRVSEIIYKKEVSAWLKFDTIFRLTPSGREFKCLLKKLHSFTEDVISKRKAYFEETKKNDNLEKRKPQSFLDCLITMEIENPGIFTPLDIREEVDTFMFEGHDTTAAAIVNCLWFLGLNPKIQEKVTDEMDSIFGVDDRPVSYSDLSAMVYLEKVIKETLRLCPSVPLMTRRLNKDVVSHEGLLVPKGANFILFPMAVHRNDTIYPDPENFDPERFNEDECRKRHPYAYFPFSAGPRNCIGQKFAMHELKVVLSTLMRNFEVKSHTPLEGMKAAPLVILRWNKKILVEFKSRTV